MHCKKQPILIILEINDEEANVSFDEVKTIKR